jgi:predicted oxidoreductase
MRYLDRNGFIIPRIVVGCAGMGNTTPENAAALIQTALDNGINFFDHADIYDRGTSEEVFAKGLKLSGVSRDKIILQSKTGIRYTYYDFSKEYIIGAVEGILKRLETDYIDVLCMHRPDALMEPDEVAEAFESLHQSGKVLHFGVSNHTPLQMELIKTRLKLPLEFNQLQLSIAHAGMIEQGVVVNMDEHGSADRAGEVLNYSRIHDVTIQAWSPLKYDSPKGHRGFYVGSSEFPELNKRLTRIAQEHGITETALSIAWLLRHPANIQAIVGTKTPSRLAELAKAADVTLTRPEWYDLYTADHTLP